MKKIMIGILIFIVAIIVIVEGYYYGNMFYQKSQAKKPIEEAIQSLRIPKKEMYTLTDNKYESSNLGSHIETTITTKKDYENWKEIVLKQGHYLDPHKGKLTNKKKLEKIENGELTYSFFYDPKTKKVSISYNINGTGVSADKLKYFSYAKK
ncbi:hypothetical protein [Listeria sp. PSOL-1]|uniref:hypothetical protein n=1 Tax=Listeria sp. PSOL-1 TaxID=1844999 RepID=UPI0013D676ED|nr:hypothetical protein [Listeria sp. PSOL-1]